MVFCVQDSPQRLHPMHLTRIAHESSVDKACQAFHIGQNTMELCKASVAFTESEQVLETPPCSHLCSALWGRCVRTMRQGRSVPCIKY